MARTERNRARLEETIALSDREIDSAFKEMVTEWRRPKLERATAAWGDLGSGYRGLGLRSTT